MLPCERRFLLPQSKQPQSKQPGSEVGQWDPDAAPNAEWYKGYLERKKAAAAANKPPEKEKP